jgi:hypothetical protein
MPQQVEIISTDNGGVIERLSPLQSQPGDVPALFQQPLATPISQFQEHQ